MSAVSITFDVEALGREANDAYSRAMQFLIGDLRFGVGSERDVAKGLRYPLQRLRGGVGAITEEEREQLGQLVEAAIGGADVAPLIEAIEGRSAASPLAVALAKIIGAARGEAAERTATVAGAIAGAYLGLTLTSFGSPAVDAEANANVRGEVAAVAGILAAVGGALAASAISTVQELEARLSS